jgi:hypothetical protein
LTGTQSRKKSRVPHKDKGVHTLSTRTRKLALLSSDRVQVRPQVSVGLPRVAVCSLVVSVGSDLALVQEVPPSQESCMLMLFVRAVLSNHQSSRTSIPVTVASSGREML